jgi:hypothetical protein
MLTERAVLSSQVIRLRVLLRNFIPAVANVKSIKWATAAWVIITTLITALMPKNVDGIQFQDPTLLVKRIMDGFVDDTTIWQNLLQSIDSTSQVTISEIATQLQIAEQL